MHITILSVGKIKEKYFSAAIAEYTKRLSRYCKLDMLIVADEKAPDSLSVAEMELVKAKEGARILKKLRDHDYVITLEIDGKQLSSVDLADKLNTLAVTGHSSLCFVIGGSLGLSNQVKAKSDFKLSFSKMTFPHQLMKVVLLEQLYRGFRINGGEPYHK